MNDTPVSVRDKYQELIMTRTPSERVAMACRMFSTARALMIAGIRNGNDGIRENEIRFRIFMRMYGDVLPPEYLHRIENALIGHK